MFSFFIFSGTKASDGGISIIIPDEIDAEGKTDFKVEICMSSKVTEEDVSVVWIEQNKDGESYIYMGKEIELIATNEGKTNTLVVKFFSSSGFEEGLYDVYINEKETASNRDSLFCEKAMAVGNAQLKIGNGGGKCKLITPCSGDGEGKIKVVIKPNELVREELKQNPDVFYDMADKLAQLVESGKFKFWSCDKFAFYVPEQLNYSCDFNDSCIVVLNPLSSKNDGSAVSGSHKVNVNFNPDLVEEEFFNYLAPAIMAHEFGHAIACLDDEYSWVGAEYPMRDPRDGDTTSNCVGFKLGDWDLPKDLKAKACNYYKSFLNDYNCNQVFLGCNAIEENDFYGYYWYRSSQYSLMKLHQLWLPGTPVPYDSPHYDYGLAGNYFFEKHLNEILK